jgi:hypothetical protein
MSIKIAVLQNAKDYSVLQAINSAIRPLIILVCVLPQTKNAYNGLMITSIFILTTPYPSVSTTAVQIAAPTRKQQARTGRFITVLRNVVVE